MDTGHSVRIKNDVYERLKELSVKNKCSIAMCVEKAVEAFEHCSAETTECGKDISNKEAVRQIKKVLYRMIAEKYRLRKEDIEDPDSGFDKQTLYDHKLWFKERYKDDMCPF